MKLVKLFKKNGEVLKYIIQEKEDLKIYKDMIKLKSKLNTVILIPVTNIEYVKVDDIKEIKHFDGTENWVTIPEKFTKSEVK